MQQAFLAFIADQELFSKEDRLLLAFSSGRDSVVLGHLLLTAGFSFGLAHVNFCLRGEESDSDENFAKDLASSWSVPFYTKRYDTRQEAADSKESIQMAARRLRYQFLEEVRVEQGYDYILTAHHLDDSIETFLINFLRGTGVKGLAGNTSCKK